MCACGCVADGLKNTEGLTDVHDVADVLSAPLITRTSNVKLCRCAAAATASS